MFGMNILQALLIILFAVYRAVDLYGPQTFILGWSNVGEGFIVGLILGNPKVGIEIGATLSLMSLGVVGLGGASVPNFHITTYIATIVAIQMNAPIATGMAVGLPVAMLSVYLDILIKTIGTGIAARAQESIAKGEYEKGLNAPLVIAALNYVQWAVPVAIVIFAGQGVVQKIVDIMPEWLYNGLNVAGKLLPVTGMAMLINYMPIDKHWHYLILGFVLFSYLGIGILPIGLIGIVFALIYYKNELRFRDL
ncbi:MAG: PTS sugar transporter subunit IIC, partial [Erysipelotrichaceae bacterium]|nr:PTS sugar transporter subunit IIC [Erysipelotrichaceae bacterium]